MLSRSNRPSSYSIPPPLKHVRYPFNAKEKRRVELPPPQLSMTIGLGFTCSDGIVLCADTQLTSHGFTKSYETKIETHFDEHFEEGLGLVRDWAAIFTYSGSTDLWRRFNGDFAQAMHLNREPITVNRIQAIVETVLSLMEDDIDKDENQFSMLCSLEVPLLGHRLWETNGTRLSYASQVARIGMGELSLIKFLSEALCKPSAPYYLLTTRQAFLLGTYLIYQAKRHVDGCGGDTEILVLRQNAHWDVLSGATQEIERGIVEIGERLNIASALCFDPRVSNDVLDRNWASVLDLIKKHRNTNTY